MKNIITLLIIFTFYTTKAQLPVIDANIVYNEKRSSVPFQYLKSNNYEFAISYDILFTGGWRSKNHTYYNILTYKENVWKKLLLTYDDDLKSIKKIDKKRIKRLKAESLISELDRNNFWSLSLDSLNIRQMPFKTIAKNEVIGDTVYVKANIIRSFSVTHGTTYHFEIFRDGKVKVLSCESPELYKNTFPEIQTTQKFINSKKAFVDFIESN